jgi:hypothetical protein
MKSVVGRNRDIARKDVRHMRQAGVSLWGPCGIRPALNGAMNASGRVFYHCHIRAENVKILCDGDVLGKSLLAREDRRRRMSARLISRGGGG